MSEPSGLKDSSKKRDCGDRDRDWEGCIFGEWFIPCGEGNCPGMCLHVGPCECKGCNDDDCCNKEKSNEVVNASTSSTSNDGFSS